MTEPLEQLANLIKPKVLSFVFEHEHGFTRNGKSSELGGEFDRDLLVSLRSRSDLIVTTGKTAEIEQYKQPSKPLLLITNREDAASWLKAHRLKLEDPKALELITDKKVLCETGMQVSIQLFQKGMIDQVVIHHDLEDFDSSVLKPMDLSLLARIPYFGRYISVFERRGN